MEEERTSTETPAISPGVAGAAGTAIGPRIRIATESEFDSAVAAPRAGGGGDESGRIRALPRALKVARSRRSRHPRRPKRRERLIPDHIRKRFVQVGHRILFPGRCTRLYRPRHALGDPEREHRGREEPDRDRRSARLAARSRSRDPIAFARKPGGRRAPWDSRFGAIPPPSSSARTLRASSPAKRQAHPGSREEPVPPERGRSADRARATPRSPQGPDHGATRSIMGSPPIVTTAMSRSPISSRSKPRKESARSGAWT